MNESEMQEHEQDEGQGHDQDQEHPGDERLLAALGELIDNMSRVEAAELLGVSVRTLIRTSSEQRLTARMRDALNLWLTRDAERDREAGPARAEDEQLARWVTRIEARVEALEQTSRVAREATPVADAAAPVEAARADGPERAAPDPGPSLRAATTPPVPGMEHPVIGRRTAATPRRAHPELVTAEPEEGEELVYRRAAPLIAEWRRVRTGHLDERRSRLEQATDWVRMCELELVLIGEHGLTLPPDTYPWDRFQRRDELRRRELWLDYARAERRRALCWRFLRRVLTLGLRRR